MRVLVTSSISLALSALWARVGFLPVGPVPHAMQHLWILPTNRSSSDSEVTGGPWLEAPLIKV